MRLVLWLFLSITAMGGALLAPSVARAADGESLIRQGIELRKSARDREALVLFQRAVQEERTPRALAQLGLCEQALGLWVDAEQHVFEALKFKDDSWIQKNRSALREALERVQSKLGSLEVWGTPEGAAITIDGTETGALPMKGAVRVIEGRKTVKVEATGYLSDTRTVEVRAGALVRERIVLTRMPQVLGTAAVGASLGVVGTSSPSPPATVPGAGGGLVGLADPGMTSSNPGEKPPGPRMDERKFYQSWWFWTVVGVVAASGTAATYLLLRDHPECRTAAGAPCTFF